MSPYQLAAHLTCAFSIFSVLLYTGLDVLQPRQATPIDALKRVQARVRGLAALIAVTAVSGAFVAGRQAWFAFNTFPLMEGRLIPEGYMELVRTAAHHCEPAPCSTHLLTLSHCRAHAHAPAPFFAHPCCCSPGRRSQRPAP